MRTTKASQSLNGKMVLTTSEVAEIFGVSARTVKNWASRKVLRSYALPATNSGYRHHRFAAADVIALMVQEGIPSQSPRFSTPSPKKAVVP